jgi:hypothetical protein
VTVSFSKYVLWQAKHFLQRSTHLLRTICLKLQEDSGTGCFDLLITSKFLATELPFDGWKSPEIAWGEIWTLWRMF